MAAVDNIEAKEAEIGSWVRTAKDLTAGAAGGIAQVLLGEYWSTCACARHTCDYQCFMFFSTKRISSAETPLFLVRKQSRG